MSGCAALFWLHSHGGCLFGGVVKHAVCEVVGWHALTHACGMHMHVFYSFPSSRIIFYKRIKSHL